MKTGIDVHIPPDILKRPNVVQSLVRNKVPSTAIASVMYEIISEVNGDPAKLSLSYASTERYRVECTTHISEGICKKLNCTFSCQCALGQKAIRGIRWSETFRVHVSDHLMVPSNGTWFHLECISCP